MIPAISGAIGPLGSSEWSVGGVGGLGSDATTGASATGATGSSSFGDTLTGAINSLEQTQTQATTASQQLATGQLSDPTQAITSVENASLAMDLASQVRTKLVDAVQNVFSTQI